MPIRAHQNKNVKHMLLKIQLFSYGKKITVTNNLKFKFKKNHFDIDVLLTL